MEKEEDDFPFITYHGEKRMAKFIIPGATINQAII